MPYFSRRYSVAWLLLGSIFFLFLIYPVFADTSAEAEASPLDAGMEAVKNNEFAKAYEEFSRLAKQGNAEAQHNLAMLYRAGKGVEKDLSASFKWFKAAAEQDIADAQYYVAYMYDNGEGVEQDLQKAVEWYRKAAERGQGLAQINLGVIYANGQGVPQDVAQAYLWFHTAAAQGYKTALENRQVIESALKEQGEQGEKRLAHLKQQARGYFQRYVQPFAPKPQYSHQRFAPPPQH